MCYTGFHGSHFVYKCKTVFRILAYGMVDDQNDLITIRNGLTVFDIMPKILPPLTLVSITIKLSNQNKQTLSNHCHYHHHEII